MAELFDFSQLNASDVTVAEIVAADVNEMMIRALKTASAHGTTITTSQILGGVLAYGMSMAPVPITREDYLEVYDEVVRLREHAAKHMSGPEATAHAANSDEAGTMSDHWGQKISDAAFDFGGF